MQLKTPIHDIKSNIVDSDEDTKFSFDPKSLGKLINAVTRIYPNEHLAVMREYAANACDAHAAAGQTRPIEITLPRPSNPYLVFQDWGTGMTYAEIDATYGTYGMSTKEETDEEFGFFGLGSKCALNITDSFRLVSVKDGEKSVVLIYRGQDQIGRIRKINVSRTDEPNGTIVTIPTTSFDDFESSVERIFPTWKKGLVLIDGEEPKSIGDMPNYYTVDDLGYVENVSRGVGIGKVSTNIKVILGGITYRVGELSQSQMATVFGPFLKGNRRLLGQEYLVRFENMSDLPILPSREEIAINNESLTLVGEKLQKMLTVFIKKIKHEANTAKHLVDAVSISNKYSFAAEGSSFTWKDKEIPLQVHERGMSYWKFDHRSKRKTKLPTQLEKITLSPTYKLLVVNTAGCKISEVTILKHLQVWSHIHDVTLVHVALMNNPEKKFKGLFSQSMVESGNITFVDALEMIDESKTYTKNKRDNSYAAVPKPRSLIEYPSYYLENNVFVKSDFTVDDMIARGKPVYYFQQEKYIGGMNSNMHITNDISAPFKKMLNRAKVYLGDNALIVLVVPERKASVLASRLNGKVSVENGMDALRNKIFAAAVADNSSVADQVAASIIKQANSVKKFSFFDRDDVKSTVLREVAQKLKAKETSAPKTVIFMNDANLLLSIKELEFNNIRAKLAKTAGATGKSVEGSTVLNRFYEHYPLLGTIMFGLTYSTKYETDTRFAKDLIGYVNMVTERDGEFSIS